MSPVAATLHTRRFRLRLLDGGEAHAALYRGLYTCPRVMAHIGPPVTRATADAAFGRACRHNARNAPGHRFWAIEAREGGVPLGLTALQRDGEQAELGAMLQPEWWNRRVASEVFEVLLGYAFDAMHLRLVRACGPAGDRGHMLDRLLKPFGFEDVPTQAALRRWVLTRRCWNETRGSDEV